MISSLLPDLSPSDYIAATALMVSMASVVYAKRQSRSAERAAHNSYRAHLAEHHRFYREALRESRQAHKTHLAELSTAASKAVTGIIELTDGFATPRASNVSERPLSQLLNECAEMVYHAFKGQLAWQTGLNIALRIHAMNHVEFDLDPDPGEFLGPDFRNFFEQQHLRNPNIYQEGVLPRDPYFCGLLDQLRTRIDSSRLSEWINSVQGKLAPFLALHESKSGILKTGAESLEEIMDEGNTQHFPLAESPALHNALRRQRTVLDTISSLIIQRVPASDARHYSNPVSICVAICATMFVVTNWRYWGWEERV